MRAFRDECRGAMRDLFNFALFCWIERCDERWIELGKTVEVGTALIERHADVFYRFYYCFCEAITDTTGRRALTEEDGVAFLYFMMGVFLASRSESVWQEKKAESGVEKPWQHM